MEKATVVTINKHKNYITIRKSNLDECSTCKIGCSHKPSSDNNLITVPYHEGINQGDIVYIINSPTKRIINALILFLIPIISLFVGSYTMKYFQPNNEPLQIIGGFLGITLSSIILIMLNKYGFFKIFSIDITNRDSK